MDNTFELNVDPRETDHLDDIDMEQAINFYELKTQLAELGYHHPDLINSLRESIVTAEQPIFTAGYKEILDQHLFHAWFEFHLSQNGYQLEQYQALLYDHAGGADMLLDKDITKAEALKVLNLELAHAEPDMNLYWPMKRADLEIYLQENSQGQLLGTAEEALAKFNDAGFKLSPDVFAHEGPIFLTDRQGKDGQRLVVDLTLVTENGQKHLKHLKASLIMFDIKEEYLNGTNTTLLDKLMHNTSWLEDPYDASVRRSPHVAKRYDQVERELRQLMEGRDPRGLEIADQLRVKHWFGTPLDRRGLVPDEAKQKYTICQAYDQLIPIHAIYKQLKSSTMNTENLSYLHKQLLNLGFGEKLNDELEKQIKAKTPEFTLNTSNEYNKHNVGYALHYKAGEQNEMYFFNRYDARLNDTKQTFYINKGTGMTAKEAYNLMDGRAVHKQLENLEGEKYNAWVVLDKEVKNDNGNHKLRTFSEGWNYKPEKAIDKMDIVGIGEEGARDKLMKSLEKGNRHQVTAMKDGKEVKLFIEANPADHRINLTNYKGEPQKLEHYKKPEAKQEQKPSESQKQEASKKKSRGAKQTV